MTREQAIQDVTNETTQAIHIKYCPMCGRKLEDAEGAEEARDESQETAGRVEEMSEIERAINCLNSAKLYCDWHFHSSHWKLGKEFIEAVELALTALRGPEPDPDTGLVPCDYCTDTFDARKQFAEVVNENVGKRVKGCWYCNDDVMQVVDSPNKPPINATYCGLCGRKLEVEG